MRQAERTAGALTFKKAVKNKGLERSLKMEIPQTIYENLEKEFEELENT